MAFALDIVFRNNTIEFLDGNIIVSGDVGGTDGHKVDFRSDHRFALFIKGRIARARKGKSLPYALKLRQSPSSPDDSGDHVFASKPKQIQGQAKEVVSLKLKKDPNHAGRDIYWYGVAVLHPQGWIASKDPQIIVE